MAELSSRALLLVRLAYLGGFFALLSGVFYPFVADAPIVDTISGIIILGIGLVGGMLVYKGAVAEKSPRSFIISGLAIIAISLGLVINLASGVF